MISNENTIGQVNPFTDAQLTAKIWDACVIGNGVSALFFAHKLFMEGKSVVWISKDQPSNAAHSLTTHAWLGGASASAVAFASDALAVDVQALPFDCVYFDAKSSKRLRRFNELKHEWGPHEEDFFNHLTKQCADESEKMSDLWSLLNRLQALPQSENFAFVDSRQIVELKTSDGKISGVIISSQSSQEHASEITIEAAKFYLGDTEDSLAGFIRNESDAQSLANTLKGKDASVGFGLKFTHGPLSGSVSQAVVVPMLVNPTDKKSTSHLAGRFIENEQGLTSYWIGFVNNEELEDNNEILKKIKASKRAIDRAFPGFSESILKESVTFELKMFAVDTLKKRKWQSLGAELFTDKFGAESFLARFKQYVDEASATSHAKDAVAGTETGVSL